MKPKYPPARVVNVNKNGEEFAPAAYVVTRAANPQVYKFLERYQVKGDKS